MATLAVPGASTMTRRPLSTHGMPKPPRVMSPESPHRFLTLSYASPSIVSGFTSPRSPGPMSPPMSARSFGTFIDSEPSTPAYSPRMDYDWDDSTIVLLRPTSSSSEPPSPTEPVWDMVSPTKNSHKGTGLSTSMEKEHSVSAHDTSISTRLAAPPRRAKTVSKAMPVKEIKVANLSEKEIEHMQEEKVVEGEPDANQCSNNNTVAPFGKLASKMKLMLRRRSTTNDKKEKEKEKDYYGPEEDLHWTEM